MSTGRRSPLTPRGQAHVGQEQDWLGCFISSTSYFYFFCWGSINESFLTGFGWCLLWDWFQHGCRGMLEIVPNRLFISSELVSLRQDHQLSFAVTMGDVRASWDLGKIRLLLNFRIILMIDTNVWLSFLDCWVFLILILNCKGDVCQHII